MAIEVLAVAEDDLTEVIATIRAGLWARFGNRRKTKKQAQVCKLLHYWCDAEEEYMSRNSSDD